MNRNSFSGQIVFSIGWIVVVYILLTLTGCMKDEKVVVAEPIKPVKLMTVKSATGQTRLSLPGRVRAARRTELSFKVSGPLKELPIEEGQLVKNGELIARILPRDFKTTISEARARELEADQQYARYRKLYSKRQVSKADFDRYRASRDVARAQLEDAKNALKDTRLLAPFDGVIAKRLVENFQKVQVNQPIVNLQYIDQLEVLIDVPELIMSRFAKSRDVTITAEFDAVPEKTYSMTIKEYSTEADPATRTYQVVLLMDQPKDALILPGMTAKVNAIARDNSKSEDSSLLIPAIAVLNDSDQKGHVWLLNREAMTVEKREIHIGPLTGSKDVELIAGVKGGDEIVIAGVTKLREGMKVRPWEEQREGK